MNTKIDLTQVLTTKDYSKLETAYTELATMYQDYLIKEAELIKHYKMGLYSVSETDRILRNIETKLARIRSCMYYYIDEAKEYALSPEGHQAIEQEWYEDYICVDEDEDDLPF